ncbi:FAD-binding protein [Shigella flexneri]
MSIATTRMAASSPVTAWHGAQSRRSLRDMEFVQYHPTGCRARYPMTEGCRGEGGILVNKTGYRYLQDYGMGQKLRWASQKQIHGTGPARQVSQAFWHERRKARPGPRRVAMSFT